MATYYVKSTATGTADGLSWANAFLTLGAAAAVDVAGDTIYVSQSHSESPAAATTLAWAGTAANPVRVICANDGAEPPTALSTTGIVGTSSNMTYTLANSAYVYGLVINVGTGATSTAAFNFNGSAHRLVLENSSINLLNTNGGNRIATNPSNGQQCALTLINSNVSFAGTQGIAINQCDFQWHGGAITAASTTSNLFTVAGDGFRISVDGVDMSTLASTANLFVGSTVMGRAVFRNCKLPATWTGVLGVPTSSTQFLEMYNCDGGDTNYRLWLSSFAGTVRDETTIVRSGGASDGTTPMAWKLASTVNASFSGSQLESPEIVVWNDTTGSAKTITVEIITDNVTLKDDECWLEVQYLGTSGFPLGAFLTDAKADVLAAPANQTSSTEAWTTTGLTTPVKQKLSVTFTPQEKGFVHAKVMLAKPSTTVYVCPKASVT